MKLGELQQVKPFGGDPIGVYSIQYMHELVADEKELEKITIPKPWFWPIFASRVKIGFNRCLGCKSPLSTVEIPEDSLKRAMGGLAALFH